MEKEMHIKDLDKDQLAQLRKDIVLNSLFYNDYENRFGIGLKETYDFFEGYGEYLGELMEDNGIKREDYFTNVFDYDTTDNLYDYACAIEW